VTDKQQASLLLLQREKGALALQVDSLKEENDSLKAKNKNLLHNPHDAARAEQESEVVALRKDREYLMSELQALRQQAAVALQQLRGKTEEVRLAVQEASSLRDQVVALTDESLHQTHRLAAADAKLLEADCDISKILVDRRSALRKQESASMFAARTLLTYRSKRRSNIILQAWMRATAWRRYQRIHVERMRKRSKRINLHHHITGWKACKLALFRDRVLVYRKRAIAESR
jgi:hypothetical protein